MLVVAHLIGLSSAVRVLGSLVGVVKSQVVMEVAANPCVGWVSYVWASAGASLLHSFLELVSVHGTLVSSVLSLSVGSA